MKKFLISIILVACISVSKANETYNISILTCSPGTEIYSLFGHSGIRVYNNDKSIDIVYNFGLFNFGTPNFALKFITGRLLYSLGIQHFDEFMVEYIYTNREVVEQKLNLDEKTKQIIFERLDYLYLPENRDYLYSFLTKNCTSEIRDLLILSGVKFRDKNLDLTHRDLINSYLVNYKWLKLGVNILLGKSLDEKTDVFQSMFLPNIFMEELRYANLNEISVVEKEQVINKVEINNIVKKNFLHNPTIVLLILFLLLAYKFPKSIMYFILSVVGLLGMVLVLLWVFSGHPELKNNFNILWANPLFLVYIPFMIKNRIKPIILLSTTILLSLTILFWALKIQIFNIPVLIIICIMLLLNIRLFLEARIKCNFR